MEGFKTLEFFYGTVSSAKTMTMLARAHAWRSTGKSVCIVKPCADTRSSGVVSRVGISSDADIVLSETDSLSEYVDKLSVSDLVLVDEVQFLSGSQVSELRLLTLGILPNVVRAVPVQCFGLRTLSDGSLWDSVKVLMAQADTIEAIPTVCSFCSCKAVFSKSLKETDSVGINPSWDGFVPVCPYHFFV